MAWSNSKIFRPYLADVLANTTAIDLDTDTIHVALYNTTPTPDQNVTSALSAYNAATSQWVVANEVSDGTNWDAAGEPITGKVVDSATAATVFFDGTNTPQSGATCTLAGVFGGLVYDFSLATPVDNQGISFNYFGGTNSVTGGTFTVVWHANGIFRFAI